MGYQITQFNSKTGMIRIKYDEGVVINLAIPVDENGNAIVGDKLNAWVENVKPNFEIERLSKLQILEEKGINNADVIQALVVQDPIIDPILDVSLPESKSFACASIDLMVSRLRNKLMTNILGQTLTYYIKYQQAVQYKSAGYSGVIPPYIDAEANVTLRSPQVVTDAIIEASSECNERTLPTVEGLRAGGKILVNAANSVQEVDVIYRNINQQLQDIQKTLKNKGAIKMDIIDN